VSDRTTLATDAGWREVFRRRGHSFIRGLRRLPPRVQALVDTEMQRADILGAWIVFAVAAFLGALYLISPKAADVMSGVAPVPIVAALFLILSLVRLRMAYRAPLSRAAQAVFILADFALLYGLIWSFHLQYNQPAAFYLKAPTFLFVFLLISVRALRFEPVAVLTSGLTAAAGWAMMAAYALRNTPAPTVTRDFTAYMTDNLVLVGAEVEKIVAILLVTGVLTLAIVRGRRQVVLAASETTARDDLSRFFAPEIAARITGNDEVLKPGYGEVRRGAILISDIRDFTSLVARRPAGEVMTLLVEYQRRVSRVVADHGGAIDKFLGDGILATFGCARPSARPAADALRTLLVLIQTSEELAREVARTRGEALAFGFAATSGDVLCGTVGEESRLEFTVIGDTVNRAAKLEKTNKILGTVALAEVGLLEAAEREGFERDGLTSYETFEVALPGVALPDRVIGWKRHPAGAP
jgi:adenylate cyclase